MGPTRTTTSPKSRTACRSEPPVPRRTRTRRCLARRADACTGSFPSGSSTARRTQSTTVSGISASFGKRPHTPVRLQHEQQREMMLIGRPRASLLVGGLRVHAAGASPRAGRGAGRSTAHVDVVANERAAGHVPIADVEPTLAQLGIAAFTYRVLKSTGLHRCPVYRVGQRKVICRISDSLRFHSARCETMSHVRRRCARRRISRPGLFSPRTPFTTAGVGGSFRHHRAAGPPRTQPSQAALGRPDHRLQLGPTALPTEDQRHDVDKDRAPGPSAGRGAGVDVHGVVTHERQRSASRSWPR